MARGEFGISIENLGGFETITYSDRPGQLGTNNPMGTSRRVTRAELEQLVAGTSVARRANYTPPILLPVGNPGMPSAPPGGGLPFSPLAPSTPGGFNLPTRGGGGVPGGMDMNIDYAGIAGQYGAAGCNLITNATARAACMAIVAMVGGGTGTNSGSGGLVPNTPSSTPGSSCPDGYVMTSNGCAKTGLTGTMERWIPGGSSGYAWEPAQGMYGVGVSPFVRQAATRQCPAGWVLGNDGLCYQRLDRRFRAHLPTRKPLLTANDGRILTKAKSLQKKLKRVSSKHVPRARSCSCSTTTRKKK